jgi:putative PIN family toxin of toxin-antitoxin system
MSEINDLTVVLDTNVLLVSISSRSKYHWLYQALLYNKFRIAITQDILLEYQEIIETHWNAHVALDVVRSLTELPNAFFTSVHYKLGLIDADEDDNMFVDCAFAANADYIVTHDRHFNILKTIPFPRIPLLDIHQFKDLLGTPHDI